MNRNSYLSYDKNKKIFVSGRCFLYTEISHDLILPDRIRNVKTISE